MSYISDCVIQVQKDKEQAIAALRDALGEPDQLQVNGDWWIGFWQNYNHFPDLMDIGELLYNADVEEDQYVAERWGEDREDYDIYGEADVAYSIEVMQTLRLD